MRITTLCYVERGDQYLMLHRVVKKNDENHDKWIGILLVVVACLYTVLN